MYVDDCLQNWTPPWSLEPKCDSFLNRDRRHLSPDFDAVITTTPPNGVVPTGSTGKCMLPKKICSALEIFVDVSP